LEAGEKFTVVKLTKGKNMKIIFASTTIEAATTDLEKVIEAAGRTCYKSEDRACEGSEFDFIRKLRDQYKHHSVIEHAAITVRVICDRGISHELVRHRLTSVSQESTRYCNYAKGRFGKEITVISPSFWHSSSANYQLWKSACEQAEKAYLNLLNQNATPQEARSVLPNSLKTEVVLTANPREWMHIFKMRTDQAAHPQMRDLMIPLQKEFATRWPAIFGEGDKRIIAKAAGII